MISEWNDPRLRYKTVRYSNVEAFNKGVTTKRLHPQTKHNVCVCADLTSLADIYYKLEWKYTSLCLDNNSSLIT